MGAMGLHGMGAYFEGSERDDGWERGCRCVRHAMRFDAVRETRICVQAGR